MPPRLVAAALCIALLAAGGAASDERATEQPLLRTEQPLLRTEQPLLRAEQPLLRTEQHVSELAPDARPTLFSPYHVVRAEAFSAYLLELFGETAGFALGRRLSVFELEGGAALRVLDPMRLTASFRMLSSDGGTEERGDGLPLARHLTAPYLGIALDF